MKKHFLIIGLAAVLAAGSSCKGKGDKATTDTSDTSMTTTATAPAPGAPVEISPDDSLKNGVKDATKDFPDVTADVNNGVITLTGSIEKNRYMTLKQSLDALHPKQVVNHLKYK